jgi:predicted tellurium resistance membrane protein TerC
MYVCKHLFFFQLVWALYVVSRRVEVILLGVFLSGLSVSNLLVITVFVSEFSDDSIRGTLTSGVIVFTGLGLLMTLLLSGILSYSTNLYVALMMSAVGVMMLMVVKESPTLLMNKGMHEVSGKTGTEAKTLRGNYFSV